MTISKKQILRRRAMVLGIGAVLTAAVACGQQEAPPTKTVTVAPPSGPVTTTQSGDRPALLEKQIGEKAGISCSMDEPDQPCEIDFTVTAIQQDVPCDDPYEVLGPNEQFLRFDLDVQSTVHKFSQNAIAFVLLQNNWGVVGKDGVLEPGVITHVSCGDDAAFSRQVIPGTHTKASVVVTAPKPASFLRLDIPSYGSWQWPIP